MAASDPERKLRLLVEGWRFLAHSYSIVNHWHLLALLRRDDAALWFRDTPYFRPQWKAERGLFTPAEDDAIAALPPPGEADMFDAALRMGFPYELRPACAKTTAVFVTSEFQAIPDSHFAGKPDFAALRDDPHFALITPSRWSAGACERFRLRPDQINVVPHGVEPSVFRPMPERRDEIRRRLGLDGFVFLNVGAMTENKGIGGLLRAFAMVARGHPGVRLVLKGLDELHNSKEILRVLLDRLSVSDRHAVADRLLYLGGRCSMAEMAALYQAADLYVSPYHAEGFNIPVLEAAACGIPLICTGGGATDDFVDDRFCRRIPSRSETVHYERIAGKQLWPDFDRLAGLMTESMEDGAWRDEAARAGALHASSNYNWDIVAEKLLRVLAR